MLSTGTKLGPYEITGSLGAGGMGEVYCARDSRLGRNVAIKVLPESLAHDPDRLRRFEQEARIVGSLNHPNIVAIYDVGAQDGVHYLVSELLEGDTLRHRVGERPLPMRKVKEYGFQIVRGLAAAHDKGIVHRDLKPENIFVTRDEQVKILDFGLAKPVRVLQAEATATVTKTMAGVVLGTVGYMSPEQVRGGTVDHRTDIFSFGALMYEMVSGRRAFRGESSIETMNAILKEEPPTEEAGSFSNSPGLERVLRRCLEKAPERRFQSASDLAFAIEALSDVTSSTSTRQLAKPSTPGKVWVIGALIAFAVIAAGGYTAWSMLRPAAPEYRSLVFGPGYVSSARFTPDASKIVYGAAWNGKPSNIFEVEPEGSAQRSLGLPPAEVMGVSATGDMAISLGRHHQFQWVAAGTLARAPLSGQAARPLLDHVCDADISADGKQFAIVRCTRTEQTLEYPVGHVLFRTNGYVDKVRISRNGERIAFAEHPIFGDDRGFISVIGTDGKLKRLTEEWASIKGLTWSPSGEEVWFSGNTGTRFSDEVRAVSLEGRLRTVLAAPADVWVQDTAPDGRVLVLNARSTSEIIVHRFGREKDEGLDLQGGENVVAGISDDGKMLVVTNTGIGSDYETEIINTDSPVPVVLGEGSACGISPDGKWVLASLPSAPSKIIIYPTGTGDTRRLDISPVRNTGIYCSWTAAGNQVLFTGDEPGKSERAYILDLNNGNVRPVSPEETTGALVSPDGKLVVAKHNGVHFVYPAVGSDPQPVLGLSEEESPVGWHQSSQKLFAWNGHFPARVFLIDYKTGKRERWAEFTPPESSGLLWGSMVITPDGRSYSYRYRRILTSLFLVDGLR